MLISDYREALVEVLEILKYASQEDRNKIPKRLLLFFEKNASPNYKFVIDDNKEIKNLKLKPETKGLLAMIYRNYWCTPEERKKYDKILNDNQKLYDTMIREKYNPDKIFENNSYSNPQKDKKQIEETTEEKQPALVKSQNALSKISEKSHNFFNKFKPRPKSI